MEKNLARTGPNRPWPNRRWPITLVLDAKHLPAAMLLCPNCTSDEFHLYLTGETMHAQCGRCGEIHCLHDGPCGPETAE